MYFGEYIQSEMLVPLERKVIMMKYEMEIIIEVIDTAIMNIEALKSDIE